MPRHHRFLLAVAMLFLPAMAQAQTLPGISGTLPGAGAPAAPTYGYQPYNPSNPTGFNHPNDMGYGSYHNPTKLTGHRSGSMGYRRFKGY